MSQLTQHDLQRLLHSTRHNRNYDAARASVVLYQYYVRLTSITTIAIHLHISYSRAITIRKDAITKLRKVWPLFSQSDVAKLHANTGLRHDLWPTTTTQPTTPKTH